MSDPMRRISLVTSHLAPAGTRTTTTHSTAKQQQARRPPAPRASEYRYFLPFQSTWRDNDQYHHFNNVTYSQYFDSITNEFLLNECRMNSTTDPIGLIVHSETSFDQQVAYPSPVVAALAIRELSRRKVVWNVALFNATYLDDTAGGGGSSLRGEKGEFGRKIGIARRRRRRRDRGRAGPDEGDRDQDDEDEDEEVTAAAWGTMTHVFVERGGERNRVVDELPAAWRDKLEGLLVENGET